jgi:selenocysteine lyase/cysteine desulfurase
VPFDTGTGRLDLAALEAAIGPKTRLVAVGMASNALGTVTDVATICTQATAAGALSFVDAVHAAAHLPIDVRRIGCDFLACSAYKFYGPHIGVLFGRGAQLEALDLPKLIPAADDPPESLETGTQNHEGIVGAAAAVQFLAALSPDAATRRDAIRTTLVALHHRGEALLSAMWSGLSAIPGVTCHGPRPGMPRTPTVGFTVAGKTSEQVTIALAADGVFVSHGDFYAVTVIERLGVEGLVRAGCACYTTPAEVERLVEGVRRLAGA